MKPQSVCKRTGGFTMIEMIMVAALFSLVFLAVYSIFDSSRAVYQGGLGKTNAQMNARVAMDEIVRRVRMAGYIPENVPVPPIPAVGSRIRVHFGGQNVLAVYGDLDNSGASNVFIFCVNASQLLMVKGAAINATYACNANAATVLANDVQALNFYYFDANNAALAITPPGVPSLDSQALGAFATPPGAAAAPSFTLAGTTNRRAVQSIAIMLTAKDCSPSPCQAQMAPGQQAELFTLTSTVKLRNSDPDPIGL